MILEHIRGVTDAEYENIRLATIGMSILVSKLTPINKDSRSCRNSVMAKTLVAPLVDMPTKTTYQIAENGHLINNNGRSGTYIVLSADAMLGKKTNLFGEEIHVVGRTCEVDNSVRTSTSSTGNFLREKFDMECPGNLSITETCFIS